MSDERVTVSVDLECLKALLAASTEAAEDLNAELADRYGPEPQYPSEARRYARDREPADRVLAIVAEIRARTPAFREETP